MTTTDHPSSLPEQEPTSPTVAVLCDGEAWAKTGDDWKSPRHFCSWGGLRNLAAERGGAFLFDLANLPTGLTEAQKGAFADDRVTATWKSGDSDEKLAELLRVAEMEGAHAVAERDGVTYSGPAKVRRYAVETLTIGDAGAPYHIGFYCPGWTITVTAPKPADPTGGDPVVLARASDLDYKRVYFLAEDGKWVTGRDCKFGVWTTENMIDVKRLSAETIAELMGGAL